MDNLNAPLNKRLPMFDVKDVNHRLFERPSQKRLPMFDVNNVKSYDTY